MTAPAEPRILAEVGGLAVAERGPLVLVVDRGAGPWATVAFVLGVLALVFGGFGAVTLALAGGSGAAVPWWLSSLFLVVGVVFLAAVLGVLRRIRNANSRPLSDYRPVAIFDRARRVLVDADGVVLAPLNQIRLQTRTQLTSSSPMLVVVTPNGSRVLKRGNPFHGGLGDLEAALNAAVFGQRR